MRSDNRFGVGRALVAGALALLVTGCVGMPLSGPSNIKNQAGITPASESFRDLVRLPAPKGRIVAAVYGFRDQSGQYKPAPDSSFSTAVTQGATSILLKALRDSQWFVPVERENLQNLLTERKIIRAVNGNSTDPKLGPSPLAPASIILEGGVVAYESNVKTGGAGARYLGIGASSLYRADQVTVVLRAVDIRTGRILNSVSTTKAIFSHQVGLNVFKFVKYKHLLELEAGYTRNEPAQLCVTDAIEAAVVHLIVQGLVDNSWALHDPADMKSPIVQAYLAEQKSQFLADPKEAARPPQPARQQPAPEPEPTIEQKQDQTSALPQPRLVAVDSTRFADERPRFRLHLNGPVRPVVFAAGVPARLWHDLRNTDRYQGTGCGSNKHGAWREHRGAHNRTRVELPQARPVTNVAVVEGNDRLRVIGQARSIG